MLPLIQYEKTARRDLPAGRPAWFHFYLLCRYNRHSTAERHSKCSHIRNDCVYNNHTESEATPIGACLTGKVPVHKSVYSKNGMARARKKTVVVISPDKMPQPAPAMRLGISSE